MAIARNAAGRFVAGAPKSVGGSASAARAVSKAIADHGIRVSTRVNGMDDLRRVLSGMPRNVRRKVARAGLSPAAGMLRKEIRRAAPKDTDLYGIPDNELPRSIGRRKKTYGRSGVVLEVIGVAGGPGQSDKLKKLIRRRAHFVERGAIDLPARPFVRPVWLANQRRAERMIEEALKKIVEEAV